MDKNKVVIVNKNVATHHEQGDERVFFTTGAAEAAGHLLKTNPEFIEFVGGDGTFSATLNEILISNPDFLTNRKIQITPKGSGNDRIKSLREIEISTSDINNKENHRPAIITDDYLLATINGNVKRYIFNIGGIGLDSQTLLEFEALRTYKIPPALKYFGAATNAIYKLNGYKGSVVYNTKAQVNATAEPIMFLFMLGRYFGGGMPINNRLVNNDGHFETVILNRGTNLKLFRSLIGISLLKKEQYKNPLVNYLDPVTKVGLQISGWDKFYFESDGEVLMKDNKPLLIRSIQVEVAGKINYLLT